MAPLLDEGRVRRDKAAHTSFPSFVRRGVGEVEFLLKGEEEIPGGRIIDA